MVNEKLTKDEIQKQMYLEIKELREQATKCDEEIDYRKSNIKEGKKEALGFGLKTIGILAVGAAITLGLFYGFGSLALTLPKSFGQLLLAFLPASVGLGGTIGFIIDPVKDTIDSIKDVLNQKYFKELKEEEKQPIVEKLNMLESMTDEESRKYIKHKLSKDETLLESFVYYHNKKKNTEVQKQKPVAKTIEDSKEETNTK